MDKELLEVEHRPFPLPDGKWIMKQDWHNLFFLHWPVKEEIIRAHVPSVIELDVFNSKGYLSVIPFEVKNFHFRGLPPLPMISSYLELNVRTYVTYKGKPGVYFFSLDANDLLDVIGAKTFFSLPYRKAIMDCTSIEENGLFTFESECKGQLEKFKGSFQTSPEIYIPEPGSLEHWLAERYCLYTVRNGEILRGNIHHTEWKLQKAKAEIPENTLASFLPKTHFDNEPLISFSAFKRAYFWPPEKA